MATESWFMHELIRFVILGFGGSLVILHLKISSVKKNSLNLSSGRKFDGRLDFRQRVYQ